MINNNNGFLLLKKEKNQTSFFALKSVQKKLKLAKVGHCGTLDPFAQGLLILTINRATKLQDYFSNMDKEYIVKGEFGYQTDTFDVTGKIINRSNNKNVNLKIFKKSLINFLGIQYQTPPIYSAIKYKGIPLYKYARNNNSNLIKIEKFKRKINIKSLELKFFKYPFFKIKILCSKGTYIRSLINDIGIINNNFASAVELERISCGNYSIKNAKKISDININNIISIKKMLNLEQVIISKEKLNEIKNGHNIIINNTSANFIMILYKNIEIAIYQQIFVNYYKKYLII